MEEETEREMVKCWFCSKDILAEAKKCKYCGEWVKIQNNNKKKEIKCPYCSKITDFNSMRCNYCNKVLTPGDKENLINSIDDKNETENKTKHSVNLQVGSKYTGAKYSCPYCDKLLLPNDYLKCSYCKKWLKKQVAVGSSFLLLLLYFTIDGANSVINPPTPNVYTNQSTNTSSGEYIQKANYFGAYNKSDLDLLIELSVHNDRNAIDQLISTGRVFIIESGKKVYLDESGGLLSGMMKVRPEGGTSGYWVLREAVQ